MINAFSIMLFILGLSLMSVGIGLAAITQTVITSGSLVTNMFEDSQGTVRTVQPYLVVGVVLIAFGTIILVGAFVITRSEKTIKERPKPKGRKRRRQVKTSNRNL